MTNAEYFNQLLGYKEEPHLQAFKMILGQLIELNPEINFNWCLPIYKHQIEWLNEERKEKEYEIQSRR